MQIKERRRQKQTGHILKYDLFVFVVKCSIAVLLLNGASQGTVNRNPIADQQKNKNLLL
jgi:hypothetical protein